MLSARSRRESLSRPFPKDCKDSDSQAIMKERVKQIYDIYLA